MKKAYFISDLHLGATYSGDRIEREREAVAWLETIAEDCAELYLLGDVLDYWYEYRTVVPRGYVRFFGALARLADSGVKITWIIGNHDIWIFDYLPSELGVRVVDGVLDTQVLGATRMVMAHGDGQGVRNLKFKIIRNIFRNRLCQRLYAAVHPRWTVPLAHLWSSSSRESGEGRSQADAQAAAAQERGLAKSMARLYDFCEEYQMEAKDPKPRYYLFGHLHRRGERALFDGAEMIVLPAWMGEHGFGWYDGKSFEFCTF